jgi:hypothetical protein
MCTTRRLGALLMLIGAFALPASAQLTTGTITGSIKDSQGAVIPGALVALISESRGLKQESTSDANGAFVFPNLSPETYTVEVALDGFKKVKRAGVAVSPGDRVVVPTLTLEVGGLEEVVQVRAEAPLIQAQSGERSFTIATQSVENLPMANRNFATLATLAPGVNGTARVGGGGDTNFMMDGVSTMDTGSNRLIVAVNVESIAEVKVLTSGYQAEYGRSSGLQITAVTKGGTNQVRGSLYDVERNSDWNSNSRTNILNGDPKTVSKQRDWGYSIGGPVGKPGGRNKLFFFYAQEFQPRTGGGEVVRYRMPTALERQGDFSQSTDNNGNLYNLIRDASTNLPCTAANTAGCFRDGNVLGRIPANRLYQTGLNVLKMFPEANRAATASSPYNYEITRPNQNLLSYQPAVRLDYQPMASLRGSFKYTGWMQRKEAINGTIPGWGDTLMQRPVVSTFAASVNYNLNSTTFVEGTLGRSANEQAGCALQGGGPSFCTAALPVNDISNRLNAGLGALPMIFPDANVINPDYYAYSVFNSEKPQIWDGTRLQLPPSFVWGNRVSNTTPNYAPPNVPFPGFLNTNRSWDVSFSLTKVAGRHTFKTGYYNTHSFKAQQRANWNGTVTFSNDSNNPLDSTFGFANAALGIFSNYSQASAYVEGAFVYTNREAYIQDNWKVNNKLTLDYGVRLVHQQPQYDSLGQASNFLPEKWSAGAAPVLYTGGCVNGVYPCTGTNRQAMNPLTGQLLGPNTVAAIGTLVPSSGNFTNGLFLSGQGIADTTYTYPALGVAPRFGMAYDVTGSQHLVLRGGAGLFFDRPDGNAIMPQVQNPPAYTSVNIRYAQLQSLGSSGFTTQGAPALSVYEYDSKLPSSTQWNAGMQMALPGAVTLDVAYVGQHSFNTLQTVNINAVDFNQAFLPQNQDPSLTASATPGASAQSTDILRAYRGYGAISQQWSRGWRTYHSLQLSFQRRFSRGLSFGFNDTISLADTQNTAARLQHAADGSYTIRADQADADALLGSSVANRHIMKSNFVWDLPDIHGSGRARRALGILVNDWQVSGVWTGLTGAPYTVGFSYDNGGSSVNLTGSPDYAARIRIVGDPDSGCSGDPLRQFNTAAFQGPVPGSLGLESGNAYLRGCFSSTLDLSIARNIRIGGVRNLQFRVDVFNANNAAGITGRNTTLNLVNPNNAVTATNLPFDASGTVIASRAIPSNAGFGVANGYQTPRSVQAQLRFSF